MDVVRKKGKPKKIKTKTETIDNPTTRVPEQQIVTARNFYNMGMDAEFAFKQPGTPGRDSCQKLWRFWDNELRNSYNMDTSERQIMDKQKMNESYKRILFKLEIQLNKYETILDSEFKEWQRDAKRMEDMGKGDKVKTYQINNRLEMGKLKILQTILETRDAMAGLSITSTINERHESEILKYLQAKADRYAEIDAQFREKEARLRERARNQNIPKKLHQQKDIDELSEL